MALPNDNPSRPTATNPYFQDNNFAKGVEMRNNNVALWENLNYLNDGENINDATAASVADADRFGFFQAVGAILKKITFANLRAALFPTGATLQTVYAETASTITGTTAFIWDDTIPQNSEGNELLTCTITPRFASSKLIVEASFFGGEDSNVSSSFIMGALFRDSTADAIAARGNGAYVPNGEMGVNLDIGEIYLCTQVNASSTTATTFKLRGGLAGPGASATFRANGVNGGRRLGGAMKIWIRITEVAG